jgi:hypothetical protein
MDEAGDKMVTNYTGIPNINARKGGKHGGACARVKFGSATVPIYRSQSKGRTRYFVCYHRDGKRLRQTFADLAAAKKEAQLVAQRIQAGMQHVTDLKPHERDHYARAVELLGSLNIPLVAAVEDYVQARRLAESESLTAMATACRKFFKPPTRQVTVPELVAELLATRKQDGASKTYVGHLRS